MDLGFVNRPDNGAFGKGNDMSPKSVLVMLVAFATSAVVVAYFAYTFWLGGLPTIELFDRLDIPPQSYPILLLAVWTVVLRYQAHVLDREGAALGAKTA